MSRGVGEFDLVRESIPEWGAVMIALLTQFGDVWFLALVRTMLYWPTRRLATTSPPLRASRWLE